MDYLRMKVGNSKGWLEPSEKKSLPRPVAPRAISYANPTTTWDALDIGPDGAGLTCPDSTVAAELWATGCPPLKKVPCQLFSFTPRDAAR
jgi:hypothetical protein